jgi:6-phosphofructokinase 1
VKQWKVAVGQAGGPTAVLNASLAGFVGAAAPELQVAAIECGFQGLCEDRLQDLDQSAVEQIIRYRDVPGACLGAGRWPMSAEQFARCVDHLRSRDIRRLAMIGGNGTMRACRKLELAAAEMGYPLTVVGIPKTVDNDLPDMDHSPGFGSAAKYVALSVRDIGGDLWAMRNFEQVRIIETMGRNVGWLTAASAFLKTRPEDPPHLVYLPERPFAVESFLQDVRRVVERVGCAVVVVSEGLRGADGKVLAELTLRQEQGRQVLGGVGQYLAQQVRDQLGYASRSELLGMNQRCAAYAVSEQDREEAEQLGVRAAEWLKSALNSSDGSSMMTLRRNHSPGQPYAYRIDPLPLGEVADREKPVPNEFLDIPASGQGSAMPNEKFREWLKPILGDEIAAYPPLLKPISAIKNR